MQPSRVLCYGDSLTAGYTALTKYTGEYAPWATHLGDALGLTVEHVGMCGWTTEQMVDGLDGEANVDICDVAHRGLRRLLEEGSYTHVRQHGRCLHRAAALWAREESPRCLAAEARLPAARSGLTNAADTHECVPIAGAHHGGHERPEATHRSGDRIEPRAAARDVSCRRHTHARAGHPAQQGEHRRQPWAE